MNNDVIFQFVCFTTKLDEYEFSRVWEPYAKKLKEKKQVFQLDKTSISSKARYQYISKHQFNGFDFHFGFINDRALDHFPGMDIRVVQIGGYSPMELNWTAPQKEDEHKIYLFIGDTNNDISFYKDLEGYRKLNIYEAYFENCNYNYVLEYFLPESQVGTFIASFASQPGLEFGVYEECQVHTQD